MGAMHGVGWLRTVLELFEVGLADHRSTPAPVEKLREINDYIRGLDGSIATLTRDLAEAREVACWAAQHSAGIDIRYEQGGITRNMVFRLYHPFGEIVYDGTPEDLYRALREAMKGSS